MCKNKKLQFGFLNKLYSKNVLDIYISHPKKSLVFYKDFLTSARH